MDQDFKIVEMKSQNAMAIKEEVANREIPKKMGDIFCKLMTFIQKNRVQVAGPPFTLYHSWSDTKTVMEVGFPVAAPAKGEGRIKPMALPGGKIIVGTHMGPYDRLHETYRKMMEWAAEKELKPAGRMWEVYLTDPEKEKDPAKFVTQLFWPVEG